MNKKFTIKFQSTSGYFLYLSKEYNHYYFNSSIYRIYFSKLELDKILCGKNIIKHRKHYGPYILTKEIK